MLSKFFRNIDFINNRGLLPEVYSFLKLNVFRVSFEALISLYIFEIIFLFTNIFSSNISLSNIDAIIKVIVLPLSIAIVLILIYSLFVILFTFGKLRKTLIDFESTKKSFEATIKRINKNLIFTNIIGVFFYIACGIVSFLFLRNNVIFGDFDLHITDTHELWLVIIISILLGIMWNLKGYFANRRVIWNHVLNVEIVRSKEIAEDICKRFLWHCLFFGFAVFILAFGLFLLISYMNDESKFILNNIESNSFILLFTSLVLFYIKKYVDLYFSVKKKIK
ncbi:MAG: hypothetical protein FWD44_09095 [Oscillospiraceae bacterium]|nr:hypothetical protein [Oscillospiraceae bacterium]